jgi:hypothetical protein
VTRPLRCVWALFLLDEQLSHMQSSDFKFFYVEALDPAALHSECPDR